MNEYEKQREENVRKNNQLLMQLGLDVVKHALEPPVRRHVLTTRPRGLTHRHPSASQDEYTRLGG